MALFKLSTSRRQLGNGTQLSRDRFPAEILSHAVWLYYRFTLSFRVIEDLLAQRGIIVSYETIRFWCLKFGPEFARKI